VKIIRLISRPGAWPGPVTVILVALLPWLWWRGMHAGTDQANDALRALDDFAIAKSALHRDVLSARTGMLRNYDPLVREIAALHGAVDRLREAAAGDLEVAAASDQIAILADQQERGTEQFKSRNALLQNSLAYFGLLSARLGEVNQTSSSRLQEFSVLVSSLAAAILHLTLDTSPNVVADVDDRLRGISVQGLSPSDTAMAEALMAHAQLLRRLLPATDSVLRSLFAASGDREQEAVRALLLTRESTAETAAKRIRYALFTISLLLVGMLVHLGMRLQSRAVTLRRRATIEHLIARISTRFINSRPHEITAHVERALGELAACFGADRAYFVIDGKPVHAYKWCRKDTVFPPGWPENAITVASRLSTSPERHIHIHSVDRLPPGDARDALRAADLRSWLCFPSGAHRLQGALGFDAVRAEATPPPCELGLLSMAFDAVANAIEREFLEQDKERLEANLQQARRMETIGALASGIAHNFNNITGAILGYAETAQAQAGQHGRVAESLSEIRRAGERARDLVDQILTFGRRAGLRRGSICIEALIAETKSLLDASLPPQINLVVRAISQQTVVSGEPTQLQQVIFNLCNNAAQAIDAAGVIEVEIDAKEIGHASSMDHGELIPGHYAVISVIDSGRGMDEALLERIFDPFFTTRPEGNGLGLATVREIVLDHGGAVNVQSAVGAGTRFDIWLPSVSFVEPLSRRETPGSVRLGSGETVLVLETDRERLLRHEEILAALGYEPVGFTDPAEAVAACHRELQNTGAAPTQFDAALLCPHLHGAGAALEHAELLREAAPALPMILAAASAREFGAPALAGVGIVEVIRQPLMSAELAGALARCLSVPNSELHHLLSTTADNGVVSS
jgi:signal transduction histidine kinase/CheY-like chemotaxis protein